ncbi:MAG: hypothetical protein APR55_04415 [Methanolinea sp. SDB]|nr:MAG: hypothetical protein APR55_04415 [Methanolinea sp. SDB]
MRASPKTRKNGGNGVRGRRRDAQSGKIAGDTGGISAEVFFICNSRREPTREPGRIGEIECVAGGRMPNTKNCRGVRPGEG